MSIHQHATLEDTVYFWFGANNTSGSGSDGATPVYDVRLGGAAAGVIPTLSGAATLLTHANYPAGAHEVAIAATAANGFAADATYAVFCTLLVDGQNPTGFVGSFTLTPLAKEATLTARTLLAASYFDPATDQVAGVTLVGTVNGNVLGSVIGSVGSVAGHTPQTADHTAGIAAIPTTAMRGTDGANTTVPDAAGVAPTAAEIWALAATIDGKTPAEALQIIAAATAGELSGAGTGTEVFLGLDGLTTRVTATIDASFNRTLVVYA